MAASATTIANFIARLAPICVEQAKKHGNKLYASVAIAQAAHESGFGTSAKMVRTNGLYGIKVGNSAYHFGTAWKGASYNTKTKEYYNGSSTPTTIRDNFRAYDSIEDATEDYMDMLCHCSRYRNALNRKTPKESIEAIVAGEYATGPSYAKRIMEIIQTYGLEQYDGKDITVCPYKMNVRLVKYGSRGESVAWVQWHLCQHGYKVYIDKIFGKKTELAVLLFQKDHNLKADGLVGKYTMAALQNIPTKK